MSVKLQCAVNSILAGTAFSLISSGAFATAAVLVKSDPIYWVDGNNVLNGVPEIQSITSVLFNKNSWTDNPNFANSARAHTGSFLAFDVTIANQTIDINAKVLTGNYNIAFTVWASGAAPFNGGSGIFGGLYEPSLITGTNTPHDFNQVGQVGAYGTQWASDPSVMANGGGNLLETLAYANSGVDHTDPTQNDYGQVINYGVNQVATDNTYFSGAVVGSVGANYADLQFQNLAIGWYTIFVGGANSAETQASTYQVSISAVPVPSTVYLFGSALAGLLAAERRKQSSIDSR
jgi:hypothetical protein